MNAPDRNFMNAAKSSPGARILAVAAAAAALSGCAGFNIASVKVDPSSPIAPEVAKIARTDTAFPSFSDIPPAPTDVRAPRQYGQRAAELERARNQLDSATAPNTWTLSNTQGFTAQARTQAGPDYKAATSGDTESFANTVRKRATPPPSGNP